MSVVKYGAGVGVLGDERGNDGGWGATGTEDTRSECARNDETYGPPDF